MEAKLIILFFGFIAFFAWYQNVGKKTQNKTWHRLGFAIRAWVGFWALMIAKDVSWNTVWVGCVIATVTWWIWDIIVNLTSNPPQKWDYVGTTSDFDKFFGKSIYAVKMIALMGFILLSFLTQAS
jgi:hypothetical protein